MTEGINASIKENYFWRNRFLDSQLPHEDIKKDECLREYFLAMPSAMFENTNPVEYWETLMKINK
jgi:hypothetical protein